MMVRGQWAMGNGKRLEPRASYLLPFIAQCPLPNAHLIDLDMPGAAG